jgi:hypothetical protein
MQILDRQIRMAREINLIAVIVPDQGSQAIENGMEKFEFDLIVGIAHCLYELD